MSSAVRGMGVLALGLGQALMIIVGAAGVVLALLGLAFGNGELLNFGLWWAGWLVVLGLGWALVLGEAYVRKANAEDMNAQ